MTTEVLGPGNIRTNISTNLTKILMLFGRLQPGYNVRYLPVSVNSILYMISELDQIEKKYFGFSEILQENIERREKHSRVFSTPPALRSNPSVKGLRLALYELTWPLIKNYCAEEKNFLTSGAGKNVSKTTRTSLLARTQRNCELLFAWCLPQESILLLELKLWCEEELENQ
jgi:hypothetical protein